MQVEGGIATKTKKLGPNCESWVDMQPRQQKFGLQLQVEDELATETKTVDAQLRVKCGVATGTKERPALVASQGWTCNWGK